LAAFFQDNVGGHDFNADGTEAMETALNSLGLKELKDQLPKYVYHFFGTAT
jgi:hypothetical protein